MTLILPAITVLSLMFCGFMLYGLFSMLTPKDWKNGRQFLIKIAAFFVLLGFLAVSVISFILVGVLWGLIASVGEFFLGIMLISLAIQIFVW